MSSLNDRYSLFLLNPNLTLSKDLIEYFLQVRQFCALTRDKKDTDNHTEYACERAHVYQGEIVAMIYK